MSKLDFSDTIYKLTNVRIDNNALIDDIRKAISTSEMENDERQRITGQDDVMERWEYLVDFHRDEILDDDGELLQVTDTVKVIEIVIYPRSRNSVFVRAGFPVNKDIFVDLPADADSFEI